MKICALKPKLKKLRRKLIGAVCFFGIVLSVSMVADFSGMINVDITFGYGGGGGGGRSSSYNPPSDDSDEEDTGLVLGVRTERDTETPSYTFSDIANHWAEEYISNLGAAGIVQGRSEGHFEPNAYLTRAEAVKIALGVLGIEIDTSLMPSFSDVSMEEWYAPYIATAEKYGLIQGYGDGTFKPGQYINRAEITKILLEGTGRDLSSDTEASFSDVAPGEWYMSYINFAVEHGIIEGYGDGTVRPGNNVLRGEVAKIASLIMDL
jgi:hypothetical protein